MALRLRGVNRRLAELAEAVVAAMLLAGQALLAEAVHVVRKLPQGTTLWPSLPEMPRSGMCWVAQ